MKKSCFALVKSSWDHRRVFFDINAGSVVIVCSVCAQVRREQLLTKLHVSILHDMRPIFIIKSCPSPNLQVKYYLDVKNKKKSLSNLFLESLISHTHILYHFILLLQSFLAHVVQITVFILHMCKQNVK